MHISKKLIEETQKVLNKDKDYKVTISTNSGKKTLIVKASSGHHAKELVNNIKLDGKIDNVNRVDENLPWLVSYVNSINEETFNAFLSESTLTEGLLNKLALSSTSGPRRDALKSKISGTTDPIKKPDDVEKPKVDAPKPPTSKPVNKPTSTKLSEKERYKKISLSLHEQLREKKIALEEALRKIHHTDAVDSRHATVHRDAEFDEFRVKFHKDGKHLKAADYHTNDKTDAINTANHWTKTGK